MIEEIGEAFTAGGRARLLDVHADADHHRSVYTLSGGPSTLSMSLVTGAKVAIERIDVGEEREAAQVGQHPHVGALDVVPIVYLDARARGTACAEALIAADEIGRLGVPVFLYGELAQGLTRAELRRGGVAGLASRVAAGQARPDFGPAHIHPTAGATLVAAREPLVAFNLELAMPATVADARRIAALIREGGVQGLEGVRAIGVGVRGSVAQVSMNVERPLETPLRAVLDAVRKHVEVRCAEIVGLAPKASLEDFPRDVPIRGFDPKRHVLENALGL